MKITSFPSGLWTVVWYGEIHYRDRRSLSLQPSLTIVLRSVDDPKKPHARVDVAFSLVCIIGLGSVWLDGEPVDQELDVSLEPLSVRVQSVATHCLRAGQTLEHLEGAPHILPFREFSDHSGDTQSYCLRLQNSVDLIVLVPAVEVIRFYFGSSSSLLKSIVVGKVGTPSLWTSADIDADKNATIGLSSDINAASAAEVARIALSEPALRAARMVGQSLTTAKVNGQPGYPKAALPFSGSATLRLLGRRIAPAQGPPRFIVLRIESCSAPFPYRSLSFHGGLEVRERRLPHESDPARRAALDATQNGSLDLARRKIIASGSIRSDARQGQISRFSREAYQGNRCR